MSKEIERKAQEEEVETEETPEVEETEEVEEAEEVEETSEKEVASIAQKIVKQVKADLNLKELENKLNSVVGKGGLSKNDNIAGKIYTANDVKATVGQLTKAEKIVGFFQGLVRNDHVVLRALAEGVAADGG